MLRKLNFRTLIVEAKKSPSILDEKSSCEPPQQSSLLLSNLPGEFCREQMYEHS